jgi:hypothetical protein
VIVVLAVVTVGVLVWLIVAGPRLIFGEHWRVGIEPERRSVMAAHASALREPSRSLAESTPIIESAGPRGGNEMGNETGQDVADPFVGPVGHRDGSAVLPGSRASWDLPPSESRASEDRVADAPINGAVVPIIEHEVPMRAPDVLPGDRMFWVSPLSDRPPNEASG